MFGLFLPEVRAGESAAAEQHALRLGRTLKQWRQPFLAYFQTRRASNGGTEAINGLIELHRRIARGFRNRDNYRLLICGIGQVGI